MQIIPETDLNDLRQPSARGEFVGRLSPGALSEFESLKVLVNYPINTVLFIEEQEPTRTMFLTEGQVRLSMNSSAGRRLTLGIAEPGDTLGLASSISGVKYDFTAEALCPCKIASLDRKEFLCFLTRHPGAYKNVALELCLDRSRAYEQLRTVGLTSTAPAKLARLLLEWCADGKTTEKGVRLFCSFTHGEIGEFIGTSRETVTRIFSDFKYRELLELRGSTLIISDPKALEVYAGIEN